MDSESDASVIAASLAEPEVFGVLFDRHARTLYRYLVRRIGPDEADALLGETFRIAFEKRSNYDTDRENARPWLYGIATNLVAKHRRSEARRIHASARLVAQRGPQEDLGDRVAASLDAEDVWPRVADAVTQLPEAERDALLLFVWEKLGYDEIAAALAIPVGTVRSRLNRARMRIRELDSSSGREE
jgi:RNA polymerase sigma factor (sigma-70 family)